MLTALDEYRLMKSLQKIVDLERLIGEMIKQAHDTTDRNLDKAALLDALISNIYFIDWQFLNELLFKYRTHCLPPQTLLLESLEQPTEFPKPTRKTSRPTSRKSVRGRAARRGK